MTFPTPFTVLLEAYTPGVTDAHHNPVDAWSAPVPQPVIGWGPPATAEPKIAGQDRVVVDQELLVPPEFVCGPRDRMTLNGKLYEVIGEVEGTAGNPFLWIPGGVVNLKRVDG